MENLHVSIEINGKQNHVGSISWESIEDACFMTGYSGRKEMTA